MILALLGKSVSKDSKSMYSNNTSFDIKEGEFINSIDALLHSYKDERFILLGTKEAIKAHSDLEIIKSRNIEFKEFSSDNLNDIFIKIMQTIINNQNEKIIFDITHSFRDSVIMSVISTLISQIVYKPNITMIYAKEIEQFKKYRYELVSEDILNTSNIATILSSFISTLKVPSLYSKYKLYELLHNFSTHLVSNQFKNIYEKDIIEIKDFIIKNKEKLFFVTPLLEKLEIIIDDIKKTKDKTTYEKFIFFSEFFYKKQYYLHSSTYLIEAITQYVGEVLKELNYFINDMNDYKNGQKKIADFLKFNFNEKDFNFPNDYFVDINSSIFKSFSDLRDRVAEIRHNLAHINIEQDYENIENNLKEAINELKNLIDSKILYKLDKTEDKKKQTVKYHLEVLQKKVDKFNKQQNSFGKISKIFDKYKNNTLYDLTNYDIENVKNFCKKNQEIYNKLEELRRKRILLIDKEDIQLSNQTQKNQQNNRTSKNIKIIEKEINGEKKVIKDLKKDNKLKKGYRCNKK